MSGQDESTGALTFERDPYEHAASLGCEVVLPKPYQLQIDLDTDADLVRMDNMIAVLQRNEIHVAVEKITTSRSGNRHAYVRVNGMTRGVGCETTDGYDSDISPLLRIALQACLGSDPKRELLSLLRIAKGSGRPPTLFYELLPEKEPALLMKPILRAMKFAKRAVDALADATRPDKHGY